MEQIRLDLIPNGIMPNVHASQFDKSRTVRFNLYEGETPFTLLATDNVKVTCNGVEDSTLATAGTSHDWTIPDAVVSDSGVFIGELSVERGSKTIGSKNFVLNVEEDAYNGKNIEERTASGSIANFETNLQDNLTACKCDINPVQDLHGYTKPWSGGGGKNKLDYLNNLRASSSGLTIEGTSSGAIHYSGTASQGYCQLTYTFNLSIASGTTIAVSRSSAVAYQHYFSLTYTDDSVEYLRILANQTSATITLSKALKSIDIVCLGLTVGNSYNDTIKFQLEIGSSATTWEPYENICPISGFSGANIVRCGKNLANIRPFSEWSVIGSYLCYQNALPKGQNFYMSFADNDTSVDVSGCYFGFLDDEYAGGSITGHFKWILNNGTYTANNNLISGPKLLNGFVIYPTTEATYNKIMARYKIQVELGNTATAYKPYNGTTTAISFGQTVYGGVLDVTNGVVKVTDKKIVFTGDASEIWYYTSSLNRVYINVLDAVADITTPIMSNIIGFNSSYTPSDYTGHINPQGNFEVFAPATITNANDWKTWLSSNNIDLVYELATPTEITLTPKQIEALVGINNVYHDCNGKTEVKYLVEV